MGWKQTSILLAKLLPVIGTALFVLVALVAIATRKRASRKASKVLRNTIEAEANEPISLHPEINPTRCAGCGACVRACPEGEILQMIEHKAVLVEPTKCVGHGECEMACPFNAITLVFGTRTRGMELPRVTGNYETNVQGLYIAGELGGMGLIRNAIKQGRLAAEHALKTTGGGRADFDLLVVGAGAAGLSAALSAVAARRSYLCIEQGSVGGTISNFPRQKVVMTHPAELPLVGTMSFPKHKVSKETLLSYWSGIMRSTGLKVREGCRFVSLTKDAQGIFQVETTKGRVSAKKVVLAMGVRGSPRRLNLPNEDLPKVTYNLLEPEQYKRRHVAVVGGGNAGVEAAQMLAKRELGNKVTLLVRGKRLDRCNQENQDIIMNMQRQGLVRIAWETSVKEIHKKHLIVDKSGQRHELPNDYLFICIGAEMPFKFLQSLGIAIDKKFGEPVRKT